MWLAFYNPGGVGDVLLLTSGPVSSHEIDPDSKGQVTALRHHQSQAIVGYNLFGVADLNLTGESPVTLTAEQVAQVNDRIQAAGFDQAVSFDASPRLVVGYVEECVDHPDSDHLHITQTRVAADTVLQIVCGAANIEAGQKVLVAQPGAVMPDGLIIWPGQLRGVDSNGMICSTRELGLDAIENKPGIWVLKDDLAVGTPLEQVIAHYQG